MAKVRSDAGRCGPLWLVLWLVGPLLLAAGGTRLAAQLAPETSGQDLVVDVQVVGNRDLSAEKIFPFIRTRAGRPYDLTLIEEDVRRLTRSKLFMSVRPSSQRVPGGWRVVFEVLERPTVHDIKTVGNQKIRKSVLLKQLKDAGLKKDEALDPFTVEEGRRKLEEFYHGKGFSRVRITVLEGNKTTDREVVYLINEGQKQRILWTDFIGNTIASDARLRTQIRSTPPILYLFKGEVDRKQIEEDKARLLAYYRGLGFFHATVGVDTQYNETQDWLVLTFVISEGPRFKVRDVSFLGNSKIATGILAKDLKLKAGEYFNQAKMTADVAGIQEKYGSIGYAFADVKDELRFLEEPAQLDLVFALSEGDRYRIGRISVEIKGEYPHTQLATVLDRVPIKPGEIYDIRKIREGEKMLRASGLFLVDPMSGNVPKIVFSPPGTEENETEVATKPKHRPGFRGQSPDPPQGAWNRWPTAAPAWNDRAAPRPWEREMNLTVQGEALDAHGRRQAPTQQIPPPSPWPPHSAIDGSAPTVSGDRWGESCTVGPRNGTATATPTNGGPPARIVLTQYTTETAPPAPSRPWLPWGRRQDPPAAAPDPFARSEAQSLPPLYPPAGPAPPAAGGLERVGVDLGNPAPQGPRYFGSPARGPAAPVAPNGGPLAPASPPGGYLPGPQVPNGGPMPPPDAGLMPPPPAVGGLFNEESPFLTQPGDEELTRPLPIRIRTEETQTGRLMFGVGVNSDAGLVGSAVLDEQNFDWLRFPRGWEDIRNATAWRGAGQRLRIELVPGTQVQRYMINFQEPYLLHTDVSLGLSGFYYDRIYREWSEQRIGGRVSLGYHFTHRLSGSLSFRGESVDVFNPIVPPGIVPALDAVLGKNALYGFGAQLAHDTRDSPFLATEGHLVEVGFEQVVGTFQYPRVDLDFRQYFLLHERPDGSGRHVLSLTGRLGITDGNTPIYDRYYDGGFSTIRGFEFRGVAPAQAGILVGGDFNLLASAEYMFPITADDMLRAVVFCDTGTVQPTINQWTDKYRVAPGFGLRIMIPAMGPAPIALDFAFPVVSQNTDQKQVFSFFLGVLR